MKYQLFGRPTPALLHIFGLAVFTYLGINPFPLIKATRALNLAENLKLRERLASNKGQKTG
jgi:hypothetical protein